MPRILPLVMAGHKYDPCTNSKDNELYNLVPKSNCLEISANSLDNNHVSSPNVIESVFSLQEAL